MTSVSQTDDNKILVYNINFRNNRKKYLQVLIDPGAVATLMDATFIGLPKSGGPTSASDAGSFTDGSTRTAGLESWINI